MSCLNLKAVIFDIGGVVMRSPFIAIAAYERKHNMPPNYLNCSIAGHGSQGAWQRFERGELDLFSFYKQFGEELSDTVSGNVWYKKYCDRKGVFCPALPQTLHINGRELFGAMMRESNEYNPHVKQAIERIRAAGKHKVIALTNNFAKISAPEEELEFLGWGQSAIPSHLLELFDDFCDSSILGMRKPEPRFYLLACSRNGIKPEEAIFLDDIGINLKAAKELGMETIHVPLEGAFGAVKMLEERLGIDLTSNLNARL
ncbi:HAD-like domain-containing protein [Cyathus striatus]|nr:HAD-like domain-containing protein [Cyathus striatus]